MFGFVLVVKVGKNFRLFLNMTQDLSGSLRNRRQSLGSSNVCHPVAAICGVSGWEDLDSPALPSGSAC